MFLSRITLRGQGLLNVGNEQQWIDGELHPFLSSILPEARNMDAPSPQAFFSQHSEYNQHKTLFHKVTVKGELQWKALNNLWYYFISI